MYMYMMYMFAHYTRMYNVHVHIQCIHVYTSSDMVTSVNETRQSQATTPEDNSFFFSEELPHRDVLHTRQMLYQLSHRGSSAGQAESLKFIQGKGRLSPDKQGNSVSVLRSGPGN